MFGIVNDCNVLQAHTALDQAVFPEGTSGPAPRHAGLQVTLVAQPPLPIWDRGELLAQLFCTHEAQAASILCELQPLCSLCQVGKHS